MSGMRRLEAGHGDGYSRDQELTEGGSAANTTKARGLVRRHEQESRKRSLNLKTPGELLHPALLLRQGNSACTSFQSHKDKDRSAPFSQHPEAASWTSSVRLPCAASGKIRQRHAPARRKLHSRLPLTKPAQRRRELLSPSGKSVTTGKQVVVHRPAE
jgi:hypothetical protein